MSKSQSGKHLLLKALATIGSTTPKRHSKALCPSDGVGILLKNKKGGGGRLCHFVMVCVAAWLRSPFEIENAKQKKKAYPIRQNNHDVPSGKAVHDPQGNSQA